MTCGYSWQGAANPLKGDSVRNARCTGEMPWLFNRLSSINELVRQMEGAFAYTEQLRKGVLAQQASSLACPVLLSNMHGDV